MKTMSILFDDPGVELLVLREGEWVKVVPSYWDWLDHLTHLQRVAGTSFEEMDATFKRLVLAVKEAAEKVDGLHVSLGGLDTWDF